MRREYMEEQYEQGERKCWEATHGKGKRRKEKVDGKDMKGKR